MIPRSTGRRSPQNWGTPRAVFDWASRHWGPFTLDAAAEADNALCPTYYTQADNGLLRPWTKPDGSPHTWWLNPPFWQMAEWVARACIAVESERAPGTLLCPAAFETDWFAMVMAYGSDFRVLRPRLKYEFPKVPRDRHGEVIPEAQWPKGTNGPPIASMLVRFVPPASGGVLVPRTPADPFPVRLLDLRVAA